MHKALITLGVALTLVVAGSATADAQGRGGAAGPRFGGQGGPRPGVARLLRRGGLARRGALRQLNLTTEQKAQVKGILGNAREEAKPIVQALREKRKALRASITAGSAPEAARADFRAATADLRKQLADLRQKTRDAVRGVAGR